MNRFFLIDLKQSQCAGAESDEILGGVIGCFKMPLMGAAEEFKFLRGMNVQCSSGEGGPFLSYRESSFSLRISCIGRNRCRGSSSSD